MRQSHRSPLVVLVALGVVLAAAAATAQTTENVNYSWTAPTTGSPVVTYVVQHSVDGGPFTTIASVSSNAYTLAASVGHAHRIRVAGVDAQSRQGVWSEASDPYTPPIPDPGAPGQPGKPVVLF